MLAPHSPQDESDRDGTGNRFDGLIANEALEVFEEVVGTPVMQIIGGLTKPIGGERHLRSDMLTALSSLSHHLGKSVESFRGSLNYDIGDIRGELAEGFGALDKLRSLLLGSLGQFVDRLTH
jgi:hypothetical protein